MLSLLLFSFITSVLGHGGMVWPPSWQDGTHLSIEEVWGKWITSHPPVKDPNTGIVIDNINRWLTDQAYIGGHGTDEFRGGPGEVTNFNDGGCNKECQKNKVPWSAPGVAPAFGGGCGVFGGNPVGCYSAEGGVTVSTTHNDTRRWGSTCFNREGGSLGTFSYGSDARDVEFPQAATSGWELGSVQEVAWISTAYHMGGYTYRLCKLPENGRKALTEECFQKNVLRFNTDYTMVRHWEAENGGWYLGNWRKYHKKDVSVGGTVWRPVVVYDINNGINYIKKDEVQVPKNLPEGVYVLSFRWDGATNDGQVWLSCANVRLVRGKY